MCPITSKTLRRLSIWLLCVLRCIWMCSKEQNWPITQLFVNHDTQHDTTVPQNPEERFDVRTTNNYNTSNNNLFLWLAHTLMYLFPAGEICLQFGNASLIRPWSPPRPKLWASIPRLISERSSPSQHVSPSLSLSDPLIDSAPSCRTPF